MPGKVLPPTSPPPSPPPSPPSSPRQRPSYLQKKYTKSKKEPNNFKRTKKNLMVGGGPPPAPKTKTVDEVLQNPALQKFFQEFNIISGNATSELTSKSKLEKNDMVIYFDKDYDNNTSDSVSQTTSTSDKSRNIKKSENKQDYSFSNAIGKITEIIGDGIYKVEFDKYFNKDQSLLTRKIDFSLLYKLTPDNTNHTVIFFKDSAIDDTFDLVTLNLASESSNIKTLDDFCKIKWNNKSYFNKLEIIKYIQHNIALRIKE